MSRKPGIRITPILLVLAWSWPATAIDGSTGADAKIGKRIYQHGIGLSGEPVAATVYDDIPLPAAQVACSHCHQRSGLGTSEGAILTPAISGNILYRPHTIQRKELYASRQSGHGTRPAYTDRTLARAIRSGIDAAGRPLDALMPHYQLTDQELIHLSAYLKTLSVTFSPGITATEIHFATVIGGEVAAGKRQAMLDIMNAFFQVKNANTRHEVSRAQKAPFHKEWKYHAYRQWRLHVWQLSGPVESWLEQLRNYYQQQPVFALVGGLTDAGWRPVHEFCEHFEVPCVLPHTDLPVIAETDFYPIYFSEGMTLEAKVLARYLHDTADLRRHSRILQVYRDNPGRAAAQALRHALQRNDFPVISERMLTSGETLDGNRWRRLLADVVPSIVVLWLDAGDLSGLAGLNAEPAGSTEAVYLSASLLPAEHATLPAAWLDKTFFIYPFALPAELARRQQRIDTWLQSRRIAPGDRRIQINTYFSLRVIGDALMHITGNLYRDYFVEKIEHRVTPSMISPSVYPHVSLAPGQRFLAKGAYIVRPEATVAGGLTPVSDWIVP